MKTIWIDGRLFTTMDAIYSCLDKEIGFPDYFGYNLDALYDCLTDVFSGTEIIITHRNVLLENVKDSDILVDVLRDAAMYNPYLKVSIFP